MRNIKNQYNTEAFNKFRDCAKYAFEAQALDSRNVAAKVYKLGEIGPNGLIRVHIRPEVDFMGANAEVKNKIGALLATADDATFGITMSGKEVTITVGIVGIVSNWEDRNAEYSDETHLYRSLEEIV